MSDITVWVAQAFLALFFLGAGLPKVIGRGLDRWVGFDRIPAGLTVVIGLSEVAGAIALVVAPLVGEFVWAAPVAAIGIGAISFMASGFHVRNQEWLPALETTLWALLAGSVALARSDQLARFPLRFEEAMAPILIGLVAAIVVNLVLLIRWGTPERLERLRQRQSGPSGTFRVQ